MLVKLAALALVTTGGAPQFTSVVITTWWVQQFTFLRKSTQVYCNDKNYFNQSKTIVHKAAAKQQVTDDACIEPAQSAGTKLQLPESRHEIVTSVSLSPNRCPE